MSLTSMSTARLVRVQQNAEHVVLSTAPVLCRRNVVRVVFISVHFCLRRYFDFVNNET